MHGTSRLAIMAHFDPRGFVGPHVQRQAAALAEACDEVVIVSTADLDDRARTVLGQYGELIERANYGYDFFSYKTGLEARDLTRYDEVVLCNDTYVGPLKSYTTIFDTMADQRVDFWGLTSSLRIAPHVQSFFVAFRSWAVQSRSFTEFWEQMTPLSDRTKVIHAYEVGMSTRLTDAGFEFGTYFNENARDRKQAQQRVSWWAAHQSRGTPRSTWWRTHHKDAWNPAIALADRALEDGRLPYVKLDTLRYDPYGLGSDKLLSMCEERFPDRFEGVRAFIEETQQFYRPRDLEVLLPTPPALRPLRKFVEYHRAD